MISVSAVLILLQSMLYYLFHVRTTLLIPALLLVLVLVGALMLVLQIPLIRFAFERVFFNVEGYNAVSGRMFFWDSTIGTMAPGDMILGLTTAARPDVYMTGFMQLLYCDGIVGVALFFAALLSLLWQVNTRYVIGLAVGYGLLLFAGNLISFISLSF